MLVFEQDGLDDYGHLTGVRRTVIMNSGRFCARLMLFCLGFYRIDVAERDAEVMQRLQLGLGDQERVLSVCSYLQFARMQKAWLFLQMLSALVAKVGSSCFLLIGRARIHDPTGCNSVQSHFLFRHSLPYVSFISKLCSEGEQHSAS